MPSRDRFPFLKAGGEAGDIIAAYPWSETPIGTIDRWPAHLVNTVSLILGSPVPIVTLWGEDGIMIYNDAYSHFAGERHPHLFGSKVREGWPEVASFNDNVMKIGLSGKTLAYRDQELILYRRGVVGEPVWMDLDYSPICDDSGAPVGVMAIVVETTGKVRAERQLKAEREGLEQMFRQAPGFIAVVSGEQHVFTMVNEAYRDLIGRREVIGKPLAEALPEIVTQGFADLLTRVTTTRQPYVGRRVRVELQQGPAGRLYHRYLDFVYQPIIDGESVTGVFIQGHDVTEQHETENAIRLESHNLKVLNQSAAALAAELDVEKIVQIVTDASTDLVGAQFGAFFYNVINDAGESYMLYALSGVSRQVFEHFPMPRNTAIFEPTFKGMGIVRCDDVLTDPRYGKNAPYHGMPKGHLPVRSYLAVPVTSRSSEVIGGLFFGHGVPGMFKEQHEEMLLGIASQTATAIDNARLYQAAEREVARRRQAEADLQALNNDLERRVSDEVEGRTLAEEQLRQMHKMEAVGQLTGGIAHDFNNMLSVIISALNLMRRRLARGDTDIIKFADAACDGAQRAATLTKRLLAFSRQQPLAPEPIAPNALVSGMGELLVRTLGETIQVDTALAPDVWQIKADPAQLENAIVNLAVNARDAMPDGGRLTVETANVLIDAGFAREYAIREGEYVMLAVTDCGTGMTSETLAKAFDPFFTTKEVGKGTGLGLSQVYGFVRQSEGHVKIYSKLGVGTTVKVFLPRHRGEIAAAQGGGHSPVVIRGKSGETILVVEDEPRVRALSVEALRELGYKVIEADSPRTALKIIDEGQEIALLFTDVIMPDMSGPQLAEAVRRKRPGTKVLFTTGYTRNAMVRDGRLDPAFNLLTKPFGLEELAWRVRKSLDS